MSALTSDRRLRNRIHAQIAALHTGGQLSAPQAVRDYLSDRTIQAVAAEYRAQRSDAPTDGRAAIVTAGAPGAGKSSALNAIADGYRRIDPDDIKDLLLAHLETAGLLAIRHQHLLADKNPVTPGELAAWVHNASTEAANRVRAVSLQRGENFVMEGTLSWPGLTDRYVDELASFDYSRLTVLDVEVPLVVAIEQAKDRWWQGRQSRRTAFGVELGGRFISEAAVKGFYTAPRTATACAVNARTLYTAANAAGIESDVLIVSRAATGIEYRARLAPDGEVTPWDNAPLGAVCIQCGAILNDPSAIHAGVGRSCAQPT